MLHDDDDDSKGPDIYLPPRTGKLEQQRFTKTNLVPRSGVNLWS